MDGKRAYSVSGDRGVELTLQDGRMVMIGSLQSDDLARAITAIQGYSQQAELEIVH